MRITVAIFALALASCTYAPRNTSVDNNYNARQMAIGVTEQSQDAMTSTIHEEEAIGEGDLQEAHSPYAPQKQKTTVSAQDFLTIGSSKKDVARVQGTPTKIHEFHSAGSWWYYGDSKINFDWRGRIESWDNSNNNLKVRMAIE